MNSFLKKALNWTLISLTVILISTAIACLVLIAPQILDSLVISRIDQDKINQATKDIRHIQKAIDQFRVTCQRSPTQEEGLNVLKVAPKDCPDFKTKFEIQIIDPWDHPYAYTLNKEGHFEIFSLGKDGRLGGFFEDQDIEPQGVE